MGERGGEAGAHTAMVVIRLNVAASVEELWDLLQVVAGYDSYPRLLTVKTKGGCGRVGVVMEGGEGDKRVVVRVGCRVGLSLSRLAGIAHFRIVAGCLM